MSVALSMVSLLLACFAQLKVSERALERVARAVDPAEAAVEEDATRQAGMQVVGNLFSVGELVEAAKEGVDVPQLPPCELSRSGRARRQVR